MDAGARDDFLGLELEVYVVDYVEPPLLSLPLEVLDEVEGNVLRLHLLDLVYSAYDRRHYSVHYVLLH